MSITPNVLATRYATAEMVAIFDPINKIIAERKFWVIILKLQKKAGLPITDSDISAYEKVIDKVDLATIEKREKVSRHDVKARIEEFNSLAGAEKIHIGLTSRDLTENIELIQIRDGLNLIRKRSLETLFLLEKNISKYEKTYMVGRSHNVAAQVTTLGKRFVKSFVEPRDEIPSWPLPTGPLRPRSGNRVINSVRAVNEYSNSSPHVANLLPSVVTWAATL